MIEYYQIKKPLKDALSTSGVVFYLLAEITSLGESSYE
jgi:hypothetical protein